MELKEGVEKFIQNGANLMWPGVKSVAEGVKGDSVVKVMKEGSDEVVAIGEMDVSIK